MNLQHERIRFRTANQRFRRGRRLYTFLMRHRINTYRDEVLDFMADRMQERGLYSAKSDQRGVRQGILTHLYHIETGKRGLGSPWYEWLLKNGWDIYNGYSVRMMSKRA